MAALWRSALGIALAAGPALWLDEGAAVDAAPGALPALQDASRPSYRHVETLGHAPKREEAGRFELATDISSAPDGTSYVLDPRIRSIHVIDPDDRPVALLSIEIPENPRRLDVGADGRLFLLYTNVVERRDADGRLEETFDITPPSSYRYSDIAAAPDGGFYLSRHSTVRYLSCAENGLGLNPPIYDATGVDRYDADGRWLETFGTEQLALAQALDLAEDGTVYVANQVARSGRCNPEGGPTPTPRPTATKRPSAAEVLGARATAEAKDQAGGTNGRQASESMVLFGPEPGHPFATRLRGDYHEVAAGPAGAYGISHIGNSVSLIREVTDGKHGAMKDSDERYLAADVRADGRTQWIVRSCYRQAVMTWDAALDRVDGYGMSNGLYISGPEYPVAGPAMPVRIAAGDSLAVLQGAFIGQGSRVLTQHEFGAGTHTLVQRWPLLGEAIANSDFAPRAQMGSCTQKGLNGFLYPAADIAIDEEDLYTLHPTRVELRPDGQLPARTWEFKGRLNPEGRVAYLSALAARGGSLAILNVGFGEVELWERHGRDRYVWKYDDDVRNGLPVDIAISPPQAPGGSKVYLADRGRNRIRVYDPRLGRPEEGETQLEWPLHDGPVAIDTGPEGDLFVLGRGGWGLRYSPAGELEAYWRMPDLGVSARDITVDAAGHVYVSYVELSEERSKIDATREVLDGGIWVFEPESVTVGESPLPEVGACLAYPDKFAAPARIPLGESVEVGLKVDGTCPGEHEPVQIAVVFDTSYSMTYAFSMHRAQRALVSMIEELDPYTAEMALVTFGDGAALQEPLTSDLSGLIGPLHSLVADGDTRMAAGIDIGMRELIGERSKPDHRKVLLLISDGIPKDEPLEAAEAARAAGIETYGLILPYETFDAEHEGYLHQVVGGPERYLLDPEPDELAAFTQSLTRYNHVEGLFRTIEIVDEIPENMDYVRGSAVPAAEYDEAARTLRWMFSDTLAAEALEMRFRLVPQELGTWPTNLRADADYHDVLGHDGRLRFPVPEVEVYAPPTPDPSDDGSRIFLPIAGNRSCRPAAQPYEIVLVLDSSTSMREPAAAGGGIKMDRVRESALRFVDTLDLDRHRVAVVGFNGRAHRLLGLSKDKRALVAAIGGLEIAPGTRIDLGLVEAHRTLMMERRPTAANAVILLTDGLQAEGDAASVLRIAADLRTIGAKTYTIGLGENVDRALLRQVAFTPQHFYASPSDANLTAVYTQIAFDIRCR